MITHENTDISIAAVGLLHEMTDVDTILEVEEAMILIDTFLNSQGEIGLIENEIRAIILFLFDYRNRYTTYPVVRT